MDIETGKVIGKTTKRYRAAEFLQFLDLIDKKTKRAQAVHVILDNSSPHKTEEVKDWLDAHYAKLFTWTKDAKAIVTKVNRART